MMGEIMNVKELYGLAKWLEEHGDAAKSKYKALHQVLNHNATQPDKKPVKEAFEELIESLKNLPIDKLTAQQLALLEHFEIARYLGKEGAEFVENTVATSEFDPATAASEIDNAHKAINKALDLVGEWASAFDRLNIPAELSEPEDDRFLVRLQFQKEAAINDVANLRCWSSD
jgi:hypothetical protein